MSHNKKGNWDNKKKKFFYLFCTEWQNFKSHLCLCCCVRSGAVCLFLFIIFVYSVCLLFAHCSQWDILNFRECYPFKTLPKSTLNVLSMGHTLLEAAQEPGPILCCCWNQDFCPARPWRVLQSICVYLSCKNTFTQKGEIQNAPTSAVLSFFCKTKLDLHSCKEINPILKGFHW